MGSYKNFSSYGDITQPDVNGGPPPSSSPSLARQSSVYALTFDEFQNTLGCGSGKYFGSMNMEEFLKSIWTAEESQFMPSSSTIGGVVGPNGNLQRQGSLTLPRTMSQKTVDEVWKDVRQEAIFAKEETANESSNLGANEPTLGEMTLEEFLVRAGVVKDDVQFSERPSNTGLFNGLPLPQQCGNSSGLTIEFQQPHRNNGVFSTQGVMSSHQPLQPLFPKQTTLAFSPPSQLGNNALMSRPGTKALNNSIVGSPGNHLRMDAIVKSNTETPSITPVPYNFGEGGRGKRTPGSFEKTVERRQRRMIKNRESAARSRDRKQAYTQELEAEIAKLNEINEELRKKQEEFVEMQKNQILETMNKAGGGKRICLRRTLTGPW